MRPTLAVTGLWLALAGLLLMAPRVEAQSLPRHGSITIYGFAGGINQQQTEVNDILRAQEQELRSEGILANYELFGLGWNLGAGAWWQIAKRVSIGVEYSHLGKQEFQNDIFVGRFGFESGILNGVGGVADDVTVNLTWYPPLDTGLFLGGGLGYGWSEMYEQIDIRVAGAPELNSTQRGAWTANGLTAQGFLGYHFNFVWGTRVQFRGGYRYMKMSGLEGESTRTTADPGTGNPVTEVTEQLPMGLVDWDFSGWNAVIVLGFPFFGRDEN